MTICSPSEYSSPSLPKEMVTISQVAKISARVLKIALALIVVKKIVKHRKINPFDISTITLSWLFIDQFAVPRLPINARRAVNWVKGLSREVLTLLFFGSIYFYRLEKGNPKPTISGETPLIIAAHGCYHNSSAWVYGKKYFEKAGFPFITLTQSKRTESIRQFSNQILSLSKEYFPYIKKNGVLFLGHSMGGLAACAAAARFHKNHPNLQSKVYVITLASPLQGTYLAKIAIGKCSNEMERESKYLSRLIYDVQQTPSIIHHFISQADLISPHALPKTWENIHQIDGISHMGILFSDEVYNRIYKILINA